MTFLSIKQRLLDSLLSPAPAEAALMQASQLKASLTSAGSWPDLPDEDHFMGSISGGPKHLQRTLLLAKVRRHSGGKMDDGLKQALDFWLAHDFQAPDWRQNHLLVPRLIGSTALLFGDGLSPGALGKVMEIMARTRWQYWMAPAGWTDWEGTNRLRIAHNVILRGCLFDTPAVFDEAFARVFGAFRVAPDGGEGIQPDMIYHASSSQPVGGYEGLAYAMDCARFVSLAQGTLWQAPMASVELLAAFLLDGQQWLMRNGIVDSMFSDRGDSGLDPSILMDLAVVLEDLAQHVDTPRRSELADMARRLRGRGEMLTGHRHFWRSGFSVHQRPAYYTSVYLTSTQALAGENVDTSALHGPVIPAGSIRIMRSGEEYSGISSWKAADAAPGITFVRDGTTPTDASSFNGGVSEGDYGLAAMRIERPGLQATKSWYYFDQSFVCLGSGINATGSNQPVFTCVNQCRLTGPVIATADLAQARTLTVGSEYPMPRVRRVGHDGITYHFVQPTRVIVQVGSTRDDSAEATTAPDRFALWLNHGLHPQDESYAYIVLPLGDDAAAKPRTEEEISQIEVLANTPVLQAVRHRGLRLLGVTFWQAGVVTLPGGGRVAANQPCMLLCREAGPAGKRLSISNLRHEATTVHVEYASRCLCFELSGGLDAGRSVSRSL